MILLWGGGPSLITKSQGEGVDIFSVLFFKKHVFLLLLANIISGNPF